MNQKLICVVMLFLAISANLWTPLPCKPVAESSSFDAEDHSGEYNGNLDEKTKEQLRNCDVDLEVMETCMRCAKITKSTIVYPLCCANEDNIKDWCNAYINYGS